jgi:hypothetical protein
MTSFENQSTRPLRNSTRFSEELQEKLDALDVLCRKEQKTKGFRISSTSSSREASIPSVRLSKNTSTQFLESRGTSSGRLREFPHQILQGIIRSARQFSRRTSKQLDAVNDFLAGRMCCGVESALFFLQGHPSFTSENREGIPEEEEVDFGASTLVTQGRTSQEAPREYRFNHIKRLLNSAHQGSRAESSLRTSTRSSEGLQEKLDALDLLCRTKQKTKSFRICSTSSLQNASRKLVCS